MEVKIIKRIYESIKRTKTEFSDEDFNEEKLDILKENINTETNLNLYTAEIKFPSKH